MTQKQRKFLWKFIGVFRTYEQRCFYIIAAEQKAKKTYQYLLHQLDDPDVVDPLKFLREREIVHFQRFGEALRYVEDHLNAKRMFYSK